MLMTYECIWTAVDAFSIQQRKLIPCSCVVSVWLQLAFIDIRIDEVNVINVTHWNIDQPADQRWCFSYVRGKMPKENEFDVHTPCPCPLHHICKWIAGVALFTSQYTSYTMVHFVELSFFFFLNLSYYPSFPSSLSSFFWLLFIQHINVFNLRWPHSFVLYCLSTLSSTPFFSFFFCSKFFLQSVAVHVPCSYAYSVC